MKDKHLMKDNHLIKDLMKDSHLMKGKLDEPILLDPLKEDWFEGPLDPEETWVVVVPKTEIVPVKTYRARLTSFLYSKTTGIIAQQAALLAVQAYPVFHPAVSNWAYAWIVKQIIRSII